MTFVDVVPHPSATKSLNAAVASTYVGQWRAATARADIGRSVALPDGRSVWLWGDTFFPGVLIANDMSVLSRGKMRRVKADLTPAIPNHPDGTWYWPGDGFVDGDELHVTASRWNNAYVPFGVEIAVFSLPELQFMRMLPIGGPFVPRYGTSLYDGPEGRFFYGSQVAGGSREWVLAEVLEPGLLRYRTADGWSNDPSEAVAVLGNADPAINIDKVGDNFRIVTRHYTAGGGPSTEVRQYLGPNPWGPWTSSVLMTLPSYGHYRSDFYTYQAFPHQEALTNDGSELMSWALNGVGLAYYGCYTASLGDPPVLPVVSSPAGALVAGQPATLEVSVSGSGPFSFEWQSNAFGAFLHDNVSKNPVMTISSHVAGRRYRCRVTNRFGFTDSAIAE